MRLVDHWQSFWAWYSTHVVALILAVPFAWAELPPDIKAYIPEAWEPFIAAGAGVIWVIARLFSQRGKGEADA